MVVKSFCVPMNLSADRIIQIKPNHTELEKSPGLMEASPWVDFQAFREETGRKTRKAMCLFCRGGVQFKYPVGVALSLPGEGSQFDRLSRRWSLD